MKKSDPRWADNSITPSCGNVFIDLGFPPVEAEIMRIRFELTMRIREHMTNNEQASQILDFDNQLLAQILNGSTKDISFDELLKLAVQVGLKISLTQPELPR